MVQSHGSLGAERTGTKEMAEGLGYAVGEGAEAFSGALHSTLNYKVALALQQLRVGIEKEKLAMDRDRQAVDMERIQQAIDTEAIEQKTKNLAYESKLADANLKIKGERFISQAKMLDKIRDERSPSGKRSFVSTQIPEISAGRKVEAFDMAGREAPLAIENLAEEEAMTPFDIKLRDAKLEYLKAGSTSRRALAIDRLKSDVPNVPWDQQEPDVRLKITKVFENVRFTSSPEFQDKYKSAQSWFDQEILGTTQSPATRKDVSSQVKELKGYGYTIDALDDETVVRILEEDGFDIESIKANWNAE